MSDSVKVWERVKPGDSLLRFVTYPGERQMAVVHADGRVVINWPMVEKLAAKPRPADGLRASAWAIAALLLAARSVSVPPGGLPPGTIQVGPDFKLGEGPVR